MHDNMKSKLLNIVLACAFGFMAYSCDKGYEYQPAKPVKIVGNNNDVTIDPNSARKIEADGSDIEVLLTRTNTEAATTVALSLTDTTGLFKLKSESVTFEAGKDSVYALIACLYDDMDAKSTYTIDLSITDDALVSQYGIQTIIFTCTKAWKNLGTVQFFEDWFFGYVWEKELFQSPDGKPIYRLMKPFTKSDIIDEGYDFVEEVPFLEFSIDEKGNVTIPEDFELGFIYDGYDCYFLGPKMASKIFGMKVSPSTLDESKLLEINWYPALYDAESDGFLSWSSASSALISFPGGPDLEDVLAAE